LERRESGSAGYAIALLGAVTFIVGCLLPYWGATEPTSASPSFFRLVIPEGIGATQRVGGFLIMFGGVATLAWIAIAGIRGSRWTRPALAGVTVAWSLTWIGTLLAQSSIPNVGRGAGWWVILLGVVVAVIGTIVTWISARPGESSPVQHADDVAEG
jgi:hypothetical protein